jgi:hypothetical protein
MFAHSAGDLLSDFFELDRDTLLLFFDLLLLYLLATI